MATPPTTLDDLRESAPPVAGAKVTRAGSPHGISVTNAASGNTGMASQAAAHGAKASKATASKTGVLSSAADKASKATATGYNAQTGVIDPNKMTVEGRLADITAQDSTLTRRARESGMLTAASRGLQNSSFAAGAAQGAITDRALPVAQQDASTFYSNMRANLDAVNRAAEVSTGRETDVSLANTDMANKALLQDTRLGAEASMQDARLATQTSLENAGLDTQTAMQLADLQTRVEQQNAAEQNDLQKLQAQMDTAVNQGNADAANRLSQQMLDIQANIEMRNAELSTAVSQANADAVNRANLQVLQGNQRN